MIVRTNGADVGLMDAVELAQPEIADARSRAERICLLSADPEWREVAEHCNKDSGPWDGEAIADFEAYAGWPLCGRRIGCWVVSGVLISGEFVPSEAKGYPNEIEAYRALIRLAGGWEHYFRECHIPDWRWASQPGDDDDGEGRHEFTMWLFLVSHRDVMEAGAHMEELL